MTTVSSDELYGELRALARGRGLKRPRSSAELGPGLRKLCDTAPHDTSAVVRRKLYARLTELLADLPGEQAVLKAVLGLRPDARETLEGRVEQLAADGHASKRTAQRWMEQALRSLANDAAATLRAEADSARVTSHSPAMSGAGWTVEEIRDLLLLDKPAVEVMQERRIVATHDHVEKVTRTIGLPGRADAVDIELMFGGRLGPVHRQSTVIRYDIELPIPLRPGQSHSYAVRLRLPDGQPLAPHYVVHPLAPCESLSIRVRFDPVRIPTRVWRVDSALPREVDDPDAAWETVVPDPVGEVVAAFHSFRPGLAYGLAWSWGGDARPGLGLEAH
jgi:hypothetical protein